MRDNQNFFQQGGTLEAGAPSYIHRPADDKLLEALNNRDYCLILAPRQTGKSSLIIQAISALEKQNIFSAYCDLQFLKLQKNPEQWFGDLVYQIGRDLELKTDASNWWQAQKNIGPTQRFKIFVEDVILKDIKGDVVLFLDEIDSSLGLSFSDDIFTTFRALYNARANNTDLRRVSFVLVGTTSPSEFIQDRTRTPFNIGITIPLNDFEKHKTEERFIKILGKGGKQVLDRIFYWSNGQPLLVQRLAAAAYGWPEEKRTQQRIDQEVENSLLKLKIEQDSHFKFIRNYILEGPAGAKKPLNIYQKILKGKQIKSDKDSPEQNQLKLAGVVYENQGYLIPRNRIYKQIFNQNWVKQNTPKDTQKRIFFTILALAIMSSLWLGVVEPLFFPIYPKFPSDKTYYTDKASYPLRIPLANTHITQIKLADKLVYTAPWYWVFTDKEISIPLEPLPPREKKNFSLTMEAGLFQKTQQITLPVTYYPRWEIKQFPDARLRQIGPVVEIKKDRVLLVDVSNGETVREFEIPDKIQGVLTQALVSPDQNKILAGTDQGDLILWDIEKERKNRSVYSIVAHKGAIRSLSFSKDSRFALSGGETDTTVILWGSQNGIKKVHVFKGHNSAINAVVLAPNGKLAASGGEDNEIRLWDLITGDSIRLLSHEKGITALDFSPDSKFLLSASNDHTLKLWDIATHQELKTTFKHDAPTQAATFSPDGSRILVVDAKGKVILWETKTGKPLRTIQAEAGNKRKVAFTENDSLIWTQNTPETGGKVQVWEEKTGELLQGYAGHPNIIFRVDYSPKSATIASSSEDKTVKIWNTITGKLIHTLIDHKDSVIGIDFSPDGQLLASGSFDQSLKLWNVNSGQLVHTFTGYKNAVIEVKFHPHGQFIASNNFDGSITILDIEKESITEMLSKDKNNIFIFGVSNNGKKIALVDGNVLEIFDFKSGEKLRTFSDSNHIQDLDKLRTHNDYSRVIFSPNGERIISSIRKEEELELWDTNTGKKLRTFTGHEGSITSLAFSPNGQWIASASEDKTVKLWDVETGAVLRTFSGHDDEVWDVDFSPEGNWIISSSRDKTLRLWLAEGAGEEP